MSAPGSESDRVSVLMIGTGEYTTGYAPTSTAASDKGAGVVALVLMDLRRQGKVGWLGLCGRNGSKMPAIRTHIGSAIGKYAGLDTTCETFPADGVVDPHCYIAALDRMRPGDAVTVFTPDDTHFEITMAAVERGLHVLTTKPLVKTLEEHTRLLAAAREKGVLVMVEVHKRFDPIYVDARDRLQTLGDFGYMNAYMSQPKTQLETFRAWAGRNSDISYYLNSHHVDFHEWVLGGSARPVRVTACASTGVATGMGLPDSCEDTISLLVQWENGASGSFGTAVYTASWAAATGAEVHSQQRFHYLAHAGEVRVDQAHRGYHVASDVAGYASANPLFMKYTPDNRGRFNGQLGYGYRSIERFVEAVRELKAGVSMVELEAELPTVSNTMLTTAVLEGGRRSLDSKGSPIEIKYTAGAAFGEEGWCVPTGFSAP